MWRHGLHPVSSHLDLTSEVCAITALGQMGKKTHKGQALDQDHTDYRGEALC